MATDSPARPGPDVSIIIPTHDRPSLLQAAVRSALDQEWPSFEVLVVDDGSRPPAELPFDDHRVRLIRRDSASGPSAARNTGLEQATGRYVCFLDDDDLMPPWRISVALEALRRERDSNIHVGSLIRSDRPMLSELPSTGPSLDARGLESGTPHVSMLMIERRLAARFDESLRVSEDTDWWLTVYPTVTPVVTDDVVALIRLHPEIRSGVDPVVRYRARREVYRKHARSMGLFGDQRSRHARRVGDAALAAGSSFTALAFAARALLARPGVRPLKLFYRAIEASGRRAWSRRVRTP